MSRATGGARPWNESAGRVGQRHLPRPPTSALIDAPRQSNFRLRASFFVAIITTATTPDSHPDCRALLIQIVALHRLLPHLCGLPRIAGGSASASSLSRPAQALPTLRPAGLLDRPRRPLSGGFSVTSYPATLLVSYQTYRQLSGWILPPLVIHALRGTQRYPGRC